MECADKTAWNRFVASRAHSQFLQSWEWGEFQHRCGRPIARLYHSERGEIAGAAQLISIPIFLNLEYWYSPRGPVSATAEASKAVIENCINRSRESHAIFFRFDPLSEGDLHTAQTSHRVLQSPEIQPSHSYTVDLELGEDELLSRMREKTRYNIRLAERKRVLVSAVPSNQATENEVREFIELMQTTARRNTFSAHPNWYYRRLCSSFQSVSTGEKETAALSLYRATYEGETLAAGLMLAFGDTVNYVHGASSSAHREVMAPYAMHSQAMRDAKEAGYRYYDFGGVGPDGDPTHPLAGVTQFKKGFAGMTNAYPGTFDLILKPWQYSAYRLLRKIWRGRRLRR